MSNMSDELFARCTSTVGRVSFVLAQRDPPEFTRPWCQPEDFVRVACWILVRVPRCTPEFARIVWC